MLQYAYISIHTAETVCIYHITSVLSRGTMIHLFNEMKKLRFRELERFAKGKC